MSATPEQAAAIVAAIEQHLRDGAPAAPGPGGPAPWASAALLEGTGHHAQSLRAADWGVQWPT